MTKTIKLIGALLALSVSGSLFAQSSSEPALAGPDLSSGLLGHRYATAGFQYVDVNHSNFDSWATTATVNLPLDPNVDVGFEYAYSWLKGLTHIHANDLDAYANYYYGAGAFKPFAGVKLGVDWFEGSRTTTWGAAAGVEYQLNSYATFSAEVQYTDDFKRDDNSGAFDGDVTANYWFTKQIAAYATVAWLEQGDFGYGAGVTYKF